MVVGMWKNGAAYALYTFLVMLLRIQQVFAECSHYYTLIEIDDLLPSMTPITLNKTLFEYPLFNTTDEYKIIQNESDCFIELTCQNPITVSEVVKRISNKESTDTRVTDRTTSTLEKIVTNAPNPAEASSTDPPTNDTESPSHINNSTAGYLDAEQNNKSNTAVIIGSVVGGAAITVVLVLVLKAISGMQSGTYRFPGPAVAESNV